MTTTAASPIAPGDAITPAPARRRAMSPAIVSGILAVVLGGAIFGFFYAWVCSTMWGLDAADPQVAIAAMQAMNASVRNFAFFPAFFLTPIVMLVAAGFAWQERRLGSARLLLVAAVLYLVGGLGLTLGLNVPLNDALAAVGTPPMEQAQQIWSDYSGRWQLYNVIRTVVSGLSLVLAALALVVIRPAAPRD